jgi:hypothetical protein
MSAVRHGILCLAMVVCLGTGAAARVIDWFCLPNQVNWVSTGGVMDASFNFQLGVFTGGFIPTSSNLAEWSSRWVSAQDSSYTTVNRSFSNGFVVSKNSVPFTVGAKAYVWGKGMDGEWILFRNSTWIWPTPDPMSPFPLDWKATDADEVILGEINAGGTPFQMKSAAVVSYQAWRESELTGVAWVAPGDDPDHDGSPNVLEFAFGTSPIQAGPPVKTPVSLVDASGQTYLQISVPRLRNRLLTVVVEVSGDLVTWHSGSAHTAEVSNTTTQLVVRDVVASGPGNPQRFMRARVVVTP